jgi:glycosyltransferase involved in cell wall biosynthesis
MGHDLSVLLRDGESRFAEGDLAGAAAAFERVATAAESDDPLRIEALVDLAVVASAHGAFDEAATQLALALQAGERSVDALTAMASVCAARSDHAGAVRCARHALELDPSNEDATALLAELGVPQTPPPSDPPSSPRVLIAVSHFYPHVGGAERLVEDLGVALQERGWTVEIATEAWRERRDLVHRGLRIHEIGTSPAAALEHLATTGGYDAVLGFSAPQGWPVASLLELPHPRPRVVVVPCVNQDGYDESQREAGYLAGYARGLREVDAVGYSARGGWDARLLAELGHPGVYLPNAVVRSLPEGDFRAELGIDRDVPLLLAVGNLYPEKNHAALCNALAPRSEDFRLVVIGRRPPYSWLDQSANLLRRIESDPRVIWVDGASREGVAAAMTTADLLVLPSLADATPLVLLEAMSHGLPWLATPTCGSASELTGGVIAPLEQFPDVAFDLIGRPAERAALAEAGREHWEACYSWDVIVRRYERVLLGGGMPDPLFAPLTAVAATRVVAGSVLSRIDDWKAAWAESS